MLAAGTALFKHAVPDATGVRFIGDKNLRFSADLWSGSAGILLALQQALTPQLDPLLTLDAVAAPGRRDELGRVREELSPRTSPSISAMTAERR